MFTCRSDIKKRIKIFFVFSLMCVSAYTVRAQTIDGSETVVITSSSHPDSTKKYVNNDPEFTWVLPERATEVKTSIGLSPEGVPSVKYIPPISYKKVENLPDGSYYFNLQIKTDKGWTPISRYKIHINKAGELLATSTIQDLTEGLIPDAADSVIAPRIVQYPKNIDEGEVIKIIGDADPRTKLEIRIKEGDVVIFREDLKSDELGSFAFIIAKTIPAGEYSVSVASIKSDGSYGLESSEMVMSVHSVFLKNLIDVVLKYFSIFILAIVAIVGIITISIFSWHKVKKIHEFLKRKPEDIVEVVPVAETPFESIRIAIQKRLAELVPIKRKKMHIKEEVVFLKEFEIHLAKAEDILTQKDPQEDIKED